MAYTGPLATDVEGIYENQLGREADAGGLAWYENQVATGKMTIDDVRASIKASEEAAKYWSAQDRASAQQGGAYSGTGGGLTGTGTYQDYSQAHSGVPRAVTPASDLEGVYRNQLGREPDRAGLAWYENQVATGKMTFQEARQAIIKSGEGREYMTPREQYIADAYEEVLGRPIDPDGLDFYLNNPDQLAELEEVLRDSDEYKSMWGLEEQSLIDKLTELYEDALDDIKGGIERFGKAGTKYVKDAIEAVEGDLDPYTESGQRAQKILDDLDGLNGPLAQKLAWAAYRSNPALAAKIEEAEEIMTRQAAATGQLGGGNLLKSLQENVMKLHDEDFEAYRKGLETTAAGGLKAGEIKTPFRGQMARTGVQIEQRKAELGSQAIQWATTGIAQAELEIAFQEANLIENAAYRQMLLDVQQSGEIGDIMDQAEDVLMELEAGTLTSITKSQALMLKFMTSIDSEFGKSVLEIYGGGSKQTGAHDPYDVELDVMDIIDKLTEKEKPDKETK